jgi:DNA adenine methylase
VRKSSILRWSGSKTKLLRDLNRLSPSNYRRYVEPFAGSASLFFEVAPSEAILGDVNSCVIDVYRAIKEDATEVGDILDGIPKTAEAFYTLRSIDPRTLTLSQRAARLIFLMKACFNGVYRTNRKGLFNVPMGDKIYALPTREELLSAQNLLRQTKLINADFTTTTGICEAGDWIYLDPPYRKPGRYRGEYGYAAEFSEDHMTALVRTASRLSEKNCFVTISYSFDDSLMKLFKGWNITSVDAKRTVAGAASKRAIAPELIITNY